MTWDWEHVRFGLNDSTDRMLEDDLMFSEVLMERLGRNGNHSRANTHG